MQDLIKHGSEKTPHFKLNTNGDLRFGGISMPEDAASFYFDIMDWISDYYRTPCPKTFVTVSFRYLNSSSSSMVFKIFHAFKRLQDSGKSTVKCIWYYEKTDQGMADYIEQIQSHVDNIEFKLHPTDNILDQ
jgi:SiaC family regulatory phosphoprotein